MSTAFYSHSDCRLHDMGRGHPECPQRLDAIADHLLATGLDIALDHKDAPLATLDQLERAHTAGYVLQLKDVLEQVRDAGVPKALDPDTMACPGTWHAALRAAGAAVAATDDVIGGRAKNAFCAVRPPGTTPRVTRPWASASSTTWRWRRGTRSTCTAWSAWPSSTSTCTTATAPRTSSPVTSAC
jgi:acetoin utilization deacetylase AcuC-like enzyme